MDGDFAPFNELVRLRKKHGFLLVIDDAHGTFICGDNGGEVTELFNCEKDIDIYVGTLSKAAGCHAKDGSNSSYPGAARSSSQLLHLFQLLLLDMLLFLWQRKRNDAEEKFGIGWRTFVLSLEYSFQVLLYLLLSEVKNRLYGQAGLGVIEPAFIGIWIPCNSNKTSNCACKFMQVAHHSDCDAH